MRLEALVLALALTTPVLAGCLGLADGRSLAEPASVVSPLDPGFDRDLLGGPQVVVAHIDSGINPYHEAFRDDSPLAHVHPSTYITGFPEDVPALQLTLEADSYEEALEADAEVWADVTRGQLYWIPGTKIIGAISMGSGGTYCPLVDAPPANLVQDPEATCPERPILDDHGHGTMTGSRSTGIGSSLAPEARLVTIEGLGAGSVSWAAEQGWIDIQTNSWLSLVPAPANRQPVDNTSHAFAQAGEEMLVIAASGNGAAFTQGFAPTPTYLLSTAPPGVVLVGGHDNGNVTPWSGSPPHVVADGFRGLAAVKDSQTQISGHAFSCCTSASAPYAAGGAASIVLEAREILGYNHEGLRSGILAAGPAGLVDQGPLADGLFTLEELRDVVLATAQERPVGTPHDGEVHWAAGGEMPEEPTEPGANKYCVGCWTVPLAWDQVPGEVPAQALVGYGGINVHSDALAAQVLRGETPMPGRPVADAFFSVDQDLRELVFRPTEQVPEAPGALPTSPAGPGTLGSSG